MLGSRGSSWISHGDHSLSASACYSCLFVLNYIALRVYALCLAWTRFVIYGLDLNIWFVMCDELCWFVLLLSIYVHLVVVRLC